MFGNPLCCVCLARDFGDLPLWFVVVVLTAQFRRTLLQSLGGDDRARGDGIHTQKRKGLMEWRVRTSGWPIQLSLIAGRSRIAASAPKPKCGQEPRVGDAKPTFQRDYTESICRHCPHEMGEVGRLCLLRVMGKTICLRRKPSGQNQQSRDNCETRSNGSK